MEAFRGMTHIVRLSDYRRRKPKRTYFNRTELSQLLSLYSDHVSRGEWRDYAIDHGGGIAVFSVFRHAHDKPLFAIVKTMSPRGPDFAVFDDKRKLRRASNLPEALEVFVRKLTLVTD